MPLVCAERRDKSAYSPLVRGATPHRLTGSFIEQITRLMGICTDLVALVIIRQISISVNQSDTRVFAWTPTLKPRYVNHRHKMHLAQEGSNPSDRSPLGPDENFRFIRRHGEETDQHDAAAQAC